MTGTEVLLAGAAVSLATIILLWLRLSRTKDGADPDDTTRRRSCLIVLGSGGHTTEMLRLASALDMDRYSPRIYVVAKTDRFSMSKLLEVDPDPKVTFLSRSREVGQPWVFSAWTTLKAVLQSFPLLLKIQPNLLVCNGPGTCVPLCLAAWILNKAGAAAVKTVFVESFCRVKTLSLSGRILVHFADHVLVQWPELEAGHPGTRYVARFT